MLASGRPMIGAEMSGQLQADPFDDVWIAGYEEFVAGDYFQRPLLRR